jgi:polysaccharide pyruvyl transferase WcaK-like protein
VGATGVSRVVNDEGMKSLGEAMNDAKFVSVRDTFSQEQLIRIGYKNPSIAPDSATIMSSVITIEELNEKSSKSTLQMIDELKGKYVVFQISQAHVRGKEKVFAEELNKISKNNQLPIVFIAIGNAAGHNDKAGIDKVISFLDPDVKYKTYLTGNIFDLMNIIRNTSCYCGTSLHGLITSMSFSVPRVALLPTLRKQINYMKTWDLAHMPHGIMPNELEQSINIAMNTPKDQLDDIALKLTNSYMESFNKFSSIL